jgi:hypothetical protein
MSLCKHNPKTTGSAQTRTVIGSVMQEELP